MGVFPFVSSVLSAGCVFSCSVGKAAQNANKGRFFTFFPPPFSSHSARHRLPLLGYPLSGKSTRQLSNYKRKKYWLYKLSIYFSDARFRMLFGFSPASGRESVPLACPHCRPGSPAHSMLRSPNCPFVLFVGTKKLVKRREFEEYISRTMAI